ncbi:hypothetical protein ACPEER_08125 [Pasteurella sp. PK-2025]|uniref:hypothetical protein n=1 Tax=Pasteurella sp. PK-2025 TaxID=3413133 RepID=UPI003C75EA35
MSKQINYYMDLETEKSFLAYVKELGGQFIFHRDFTNYFNAEPEDFRTEQGYLHGYIYKPEFGDIKIKKLIAMASGQEFEHVDELYSPLIEFRNSILRLSEGRISPGRLYMQIKYWEDGKEVSKPKEVDDFYKKLVNWIKKYLPYQTVEMYGITRKEYISDTLLQLVKAGKINKFF